MNINKLKVEQVIKNYKELCALLGIEPCAGNSKKSQLKELERYINYHKEGNKFIVDEIYTNVKEKEDLRKYNGGDRTSFCGEYKHYTEFDVQKELYKGKGIYIITNGLDVYIGSTISGFRNRFQQHYRGESKCMKHTYNLLHNGGTFSILHDMSDVKDVELIRMIESEAIKMYLLDPRYNVINKYESSISFNNKYKKKLKNIKISEDKYYEAIQLLVKKGLLDEEGVELQ